MPNNTLKTHATAAGSISGDNQNELSSSESKLDEHISQKSAVKPVLEHETANGVSLMFAFGTGIAIVVFSPLVPAGAAVASTVSALTAINDIAAIFSAITAFGVVRSIFYIGETVYSWLRSGDEKETQQEASERLSTKQETSSTCKMLLESRPNASTHSPWRRKKPRKKTGTILDLGFNFYHSLEEKYPPIVRFLLISVYDLKNLQREDEAAIRSILNSVSTEKIDADLSFIMHHKDIEEPTSGAYARLELFSFFVEDYVEAYKISQSRSSTSKAIASLA